MPVWTGVRPCTLQNTIMDWFYENYEGTTADIARLVYKDASCYSRNRIRSVLGALQNKKMLSQPKRGSWRINTVPVEIVDPEAQELRIRDLEARVVYLETQLIALGNHSAD